jgi:hypothetical protein
MSQSYLIVISDPEGGYTIPTMEEIPTVLYTSYLDAKRALLDIVGKFDSFTPVAYGAAYPYENTTFEREITNSSFALLGWIIINEDDENEASRVPVGLLKLAHSA